MYLLQACAPRYTWFTRDRNRRDPVGTCYVSNGAFDTFEEYSPCRTSKCNEFTCSIKKIDCLELYGTRTLKVKLVLFKCYSELKYRLLTKLNDVLV